MLANIQEINLFTILLDKKWGHLFPEVEQQLKTKLRLGCTVVSVSSLSVTSEQHESHGYQTENDCLSPTIRLIFFLRSTNGILCRTKDIEEQMDIDATSRAPLRESWKVVWSLSSPVSCQKCIWLNAPSHLKLPEGLTAGICTVPFNGNTIFKV